MIQLLKRLFGRARDIGADEYEQLSILQQTNMSQVWLARRRGDKLITVTKIARVDKGKYAKANQEAILNEARWLHKFQGNPRIVQIYRTGETTLEGRPRFIAAEYLDGGTVEDLLDQMSFLGRLNGLLLSIFSTLSLASLRNPNSRLLNKQNRPNCLRILGIASRRLYKGAIPVEQALEIILYMAEGLGHMHSKGVVHRDIKPDNVMFRRRPKHGQPIAADNLVLIDLGIASEHNRVAGAAIARGWSEPQRVQARKMRKALVVKSGFDIYCLGKVLRYLLTREKPPFTGESEVQTPISYQDLRVRAKLKPEERVDLAHALTQLIEKCLADNVDVRPTAQEVVLQVEQMLRVLSSARGLLRGPVLTGTIPPHTEQPIPSSYGHAVGASDRVEPRRRGFALRGIAGAMSILIFGMLFSLWIWQSGPNALAEIPQITELLNPAKIGEMATLGTGVEPSELPEPESNSSNGTNNGLQPISDDAKTATTEDPESDPMPTVLASERVQNNPTEDDATRPEGDDAAVVESTEEPPEESLETAQGLELLVTRKALSTESPDPTATPNQTTQPATMDSAVALDSAVVIASATLEPTQTAQPTVEPSPTRKEGVPIAATVAPTAIPANTTAPSDGNGTTAPPVETNQLGAIPGLTAVVATDKNGCRSDAPDTWDEHVELVWSLEPAGTQLSSEYTQEVVIWRPGADPLDMGQAYTIHGQGEVNHQNGLYTLQRRPKTLIPAVIERNAEHIWGIMLVNKQTGLRYQRLTPTDCRFQPAGRLFGDGPQNDNGGS